MGKIKKILENELLGGTQSTDIYPITSTQAVYDEDNRKLSDILVDKVNKEDIVNNLTDGGADKVLSAEMGKELAGIVGYDSSASFMLANLANLVYDNTNAKFISVKPTNKFNAWVFSIREGMIVKFKALSGTLSGNGYSTVYTFLDSPVAGAATPVEGYGPSELANGILIGKTEKYLVFGVDTQKYQDGIISYTIEYTDGAIQHLASLSEDFVSLSEGVESLTESVGNKNKTELLNVANFANLVYDNTNAKFVAVKPTNRFNAWIFPLVTGRDVAITTNDGNPPINMGISGGYTFSDFPTVGAATHVKGYGPSKLANITPVEGENYLVVNIDNNIYVDGSLTIQFEGSGLSGDVSDIKSELSQLVKVNKPLYGVNILCLGDSITEFKGIDGKRYTDYLAELTGANVVNGGIGGTSIRRRANVTLELNESVAYASLDLPSLTKAIATKDYSLQVAACEWLKNNKSDDNTSIIERLQAIDLMNIDIVTIMMGTNDISSVFGEIGDFGGDYQQYGYTTIAQGFAQSIRNLLTGNPGLRIYYFSPIPRYFGDLTAEWDATKWCDNYVLNNEEGKTFPDMVEFMLDNAKYFKVPCCNLYNSLGINEYNIKTIMRENPTDGTHPYRGFKQLANRIASFVIANNNLNK